MLCRSALSNLQAARCGGHEIGDCCYDVVSTELGH